MTPARRAAPPRARRALIEMWRSHCVGGCNRVFSLTTLFSLITLPVEFDASSRALTWLDTSGIVKKDEHDLSKDALRWAASTYVVAAIASIATLLYYLQIYAGRRD